MAIDEFLQLQARERALVAIAVLLDGMEAEIYLDSDEKLKSQAAKFAKMKSELRMPLLGTLLRKAISEMKK